MAEVVGLAASLISLASLFSTCIECFDYYRTARDCPQEVQTKLVKLEFEKLRLLVWANEVGLASTDASQRDPAIERYEEQLRATLQQIQVLLADANKMQDQYGIRQQDRLVVAAEPPTDLSRNSLTIFATSYRRFRGKFLPSKLGSKVAARFRWAITDEVKFEGLIKTLKDFVDNLFWLVPVDRSVLNQIVEADIMTVANLVELQMIKEASEHDYQAWSDAASRAVDRTERGTILDADHEDVAIHDEKAIAPVQVTGDSIAHTTSEVFDQANPPPCQNDNFGEDISSNTVSKYSYHDLKEILPYPGERLGQQFRIGSWSREECAQFALRREFEHLPGKRRLFGKVYIYVAPCQRLISQAIALCIEAFRNALPIFLLHIRVDDRLSVSCCEAGMGHVRIASFLRYLSGSNCHLAPRSLNYFDRMWLEQRIHATEVDEHQRGPTTESPDDFLHCYKEDMYSPNEIVAGIVQVGEEEQIRRIMSLKPFPWHPHVPIATEIYAINTDRNRTPQRRFLGTYPRNKNLVWKDSNLEGIPGNKRSRTKSPTGSPILSNAEPPLKRRKVSNGASVVDEDRVEEPDPPQPLKLPGALTSTPNVDEVL
ncbi:MAG: hypothetical protein Q9160_004133 [Pyrenula sp. 1 TL-2023]